MKIKICGKEIELQHNYPTYPMKSEFTPGTFSENEWQKGEQACTSRHFLRLPNGSEYAIYRIAERMPTGRKSIRYELWHNGKWSNNFFTADFDEATQSIKDELAFWGYDKKISKYFL